MRTSRLIKLTLSMLVVFAQSAMMSFDTAKKDISAKYEANPATFVNTITDPLIVSCIDYPNFICDDDNNPETIPYGYAAEYLEEIAKYTGWTYNYVDMTFAAATLGIVNAPGYQTVDIVPGSQYTEERGKLYDFSEQNMGMGGTIICALKDSNNWSFNDFLEMKGIKIGVLKGSIRINQLIARMSAEGLYFNSSDYSDPNNDFQIVEYESDQASKEALEKNDGTIDAILMSDIRIESNYMIIGRINTSYIYFTSNKSNPKIKEGIDYAMNCIHSYKPYYEMELKEKYYGNCSEPQ